MRSQKRYKMVISAWKSWQAGWSSDLCTGILGKRRGHSYQNIDSWAPAWLIELESRVTPRNLHFCRDPIGCSSDNFEAFWAGQTVGRHSAALGVEAFVVLPSPVPGSHCRARGEGVLLPGRAGSSPGTHGPGLTALSFTPKARGFAPRPPEAALPSSRIKFLVVLAQALTHQTGTTGDGAAGRGDDRGLIYRRKGRRSRKRRKEREGLGSVLTPFRKRKARGKKLDRN